MKWPISRMKFLPVALERRSGRFDDAIVQVFACRSRAVQLDISPSGSKTRRMTKLLEKAIAQVRALPPEERDTLAAMPLAMTDEGAGVVPLDDEARAAIREGLEQARRGEFVSDTEIEALWKRFGL
jgi:predicted transcriptional regulator